MKTKWWFPLLLIGVSTPLWGQSVTVSGDASATPSPNGAPTWNAGIITLGSTGSGSMTVANGGTATLSGLNLGHQAGAFGSLEITESGSTVNISGSLYVGMEGGGSITVSDGGQLTALAMGASLDSLNGNGSITTYGIGLDGVTLAFNAGNTGAQTFNFGNGGTLTLTEFSGSYLLLGAGYKGEGEMTVTEGRTVTSSTGMVGFSTTSDGTVTVSGEESRWVTSGMALIGYGGKGAVVVEDGASVQFNSASFGGQTTAEGSLTVSGSGASATVTGSALIGAQGKGTVLIEEGATLTTSVVALGTAADSEAKVELHGNGTTWNNSGSLVLAGSNVTTARNSTAEVVIGTGAVATVTGDLVSHQGGTLTVETGGRLETGTLLSKGKLTLSGTLELTGTGTALTMSGAEAEIGGGGTLEGDLSLTDGAQFRFSLDSTLTVTGTVSLEAGFGIADLVGLNATVANGVYRLIDGTTTDFGDLGLANWGAANAFDLGHGKSAYFQAGSLEVVVIPEPGSLALMLFGGAWALLGWRRLQR